MLLLTAALLAAPTAKPNVVVVLADDLGIGDVRCYNPAGKIPTPHLDALAAAGLRFTDAHTPSGVCTPTRYGLMTGRYCWRTKLQSGVLGGLSPRLIEPGRQTVASLLKGQGYVTGCIGKWHLGMDWELKPGKAVTELNIEPREQVFNVEYNRPIRNGPLAVGFDSYFGIAASLDMVPYTFIRDDRVTADPTEDRKFPMSAGRPNAFTRLGPTAPGFEADAVLPTLVTDAEAFLARRAAEPAKPFFLYLPLTTPHTPILPSAEWAGKSAVGPYGDFVMQTDAAVGRVLAALDKHGQAANTLVIVTSDNGCSPQADFPALKAKGHDPSNGYRGTKADVYEGGHRVPFLARWPGVVTPGVSDRLVCLTDVFRTVADLTGMAVGDAAGEDSVSFLPTLRGEPAAGRTGLVMHSVNGSFAVRDGAMKLCLCPGSGGWSAPRPGRDPVAGLPPVQLFDLAADPAERTNLAASQPQSVERLTAGLEKWLADGRSTPGKPQANAVAVNLRKGHPAPKR
jgi:arylsulfatase A-like enzyme